MEVELSRHFHSSFYRLSWCHDEARWKVTYVREGKSGARESVPLHPSTAAAREQKSSGLGCTCRVFICKRQALHLS